MGLTKKLLAATAIVLALGTAASAKTFVYCSEGSPEGFDPASTRPAKTFDASAHRSTTSGRVQEGNDRDRAGPRRELGRLRDGLQYTFKLRPGVKFHSNANFTPTRDMNADDVVFSFDRQGNKDNPWNSTSPAPRGCTTLPCRCPTS